VRLWKQQSSKPPTYDCTIKTHGKEFVNSLAIVPPSEAFPEGLIVSSGKDQIIDVRGPSKALEDDADALLLGHGSNVCALDASADGKLIISGSWDTEARVWQVGKWGEESTLLKGHEASVWAVLSYDDSTVITGTLEPFCSALWLLLGLHANPDLQVAPTRTSAYFSPPGNLSGP
jgi:phospholipase A-2-activating protein